MKKKNIKKPYKNREHKKNRNKFRKKKKEILFVN